MQPRMGSVISMKKVTSVILFNKCQVNLHETVVGNGLNICLWL